MCGKILIESNLLNTLKNIKINPRLDTKASLEYLTIITPTFFVLCSE